MGNIQEEIQKRKEKREQEAKERKEEREKKYNTNTHKGTKEDVEKQNDYSDYFPGKSLTEEQIEEGKKFLLKHHEQTEETKGTIKEGFFKRVLPVEEKLKDIEVNLNNHIDKWNSEFNERLMGTTPKSRLNDESEVISSQANKLARQLAELEGESYENIRSSKLLRIRKDMYDYHLASVKLNHKASKILVNKYFEEFITKTAENYKEVLLNNKHIEPNEFNQRVNKKIESLKQIQEDLLDELNNSYDVDCDELGDSYETDVEIIEDEEVEEDLFDERQNEFSNDLNQLSSEDLLKQCHEAIKEDDEDEDDEDEDDEDEDDEDEDDEDEDDEDNESEGYTYRRSSSSSSVLGGFTKVIPLFIAYHVIGVVKGSLADSIDAAQVGAVLGVLGITRSLILVIGMFMIFHAMFKVVTGRRLI